MHRSMVLRIRRSDIHVFLLAVFCVCLLSPTVQRTVGTVGIVALTGIYLCIQINSIFHSDNHEQITMVLIIIYVGLLIVYSIIGKSDKGAGQTNSIYFLLTFFWIVPIYKKLNKRQCAFIVTICLMTVLITLTQNYLLWLRMGRRFTQQWYRRAGILEVVNTQYVFTIMLLSGVLFCQFLYNKNVIVRFSYLTMAIVCHLFNTIVTQRTITLLLSVVMFSLLLLVNGQITRRKTILHLLFIVFIIFAVLEYRLVLNGLANITNSERIRVRIHSIITLIDVKNIADVESGSLTARLRLIGVSINTFLGSLSNFILGVGDKAHNTLVGNHSFFFDEFAKFGLLGGLLSCSIVYRMIITAKKVSNIGDNEQLNKFFTVIAAVFVIRSLVGGILAPWIGAVMLIYMPLAFRLLEIEEEDRNRETLRFLSIK